MKHGNLLLRLTAAAEALILFAACLAGCGRNDGTAPSEDAEEFTADGQIYRSSALYNAVQIRDFLYYVEEYTYKEELKNGKTAERQAERVVRLSLKTGNVSSACVDPVCTHTHGSGCPLNKDYLYGTGNIYNLKAVGDWLFYVMSEYIQVDDPDGQGKNSFITLMNYMIYNTVTGELRELFPRNSVGESGAAPALISGTVYKNMIFVTLPEFAKDDDGAEKLVYVLRSYNVDNDKTTVLYTSDESFASIAVTNKRIYISYMGGTEYKAYSVDRNGGDLRDEDDFYAPVVAYGNLGYCYHDANRRYAWLYDLDTRTAKKLDTDDVAGGFCISEDKLYYFHITSADAYEQLDMKKLREKYSDLAPEEQQKAVSRDYYATLYGGAAQLYSAEHNGDSPKLLFEFEHTILRCAAASGNYLYAYVSTAQPPEYTVTTTANHGFSRIDLTTGEITPVPLLDTE